ncbi:contact-dependent growth inhibition system immunity protein [Crossiella sp. CA-258035]|uniref:contact-dependent growth inhibition system immunity protein n=1 Tax=Crossiella sp. CA-258035 TaxID=2981138 RepID=UPI0024BD3EE8|nr:contact-dependent growth inhibition system immunity protein [Crossiella sp. CA-258035]WHT21687.1 contact-dependent growth inhibition system immunity protein [Crossiella sp. CA-258035]
MNLTELERDDWGPPPPEASHLITRCHQLRRVPLDRLTPADLRLLIGQHIGLPHLVPLALARLRADPLLEADFYPGDLLCAVLGAGAEFWAGHPGWRAEVTALVAEGSGRKRWPRPSRSSTRAG